MLSRYFGYPILEERLKDRDAEIARLIEENKELRDRLFLKHQLPISSQDLTDIPRGESLPGFTTKKQRMKDYISSLEPPIAAPLSDDDLRALREAAQ